MTLSGITAAAPADQPQKADKTLDIACREFEGLLLGNILKQCIDQKSDDDEEQPGGNSGLLTEFAAEQTARTLSSTGCTGIAEQLKRQMSRPGM